jgi:hypothetical protein
LSEKLVGYIKGALRPSRQFSGLNITITKFERSLCPLVAPPAACPL